MKSVNKKRLEVINGQLVATQYMSKYNWAFTRWLTAVGGLPPTGCGCDARVINWTREVMKGPAPTLPLTGRLRGG